MSEGAPVCQIEGAQPLRQGGMLQVLRRPLLLHARRAHWRTGAPGPRRARPHVLRRWHAARSWPHVVPREAGRGAGRAHVCLLRRRAVAGRRRRHAVRGRSKHAWLLHWDGATWRGPSMHGWEGGTRAVLWRWLRCSGLTGVRWRGAIPRWRVLTIAWRRAIARRRRHPIWPRWQGPCKAICVVVRRRHPTQVPRWRQRALGVWLLLGRPKRAMLSWRPLLLP